MTVKKIYIIMAIAGSAFVAMVLCGMAGSDMIDGKNTMLVRANLIDNENAMLIGKEVQDDTPFIAIEGAQEKPGAAYDTEVNEVVESFADELLQPINIANFETVDNATPEVIIPNGSAATFGQSDVMGWMCNIGDELVYRFEKYPSEVVDRQTLVVGFILNGEMHPGEKFLDLDGEYRHKVEENGEYFIYVVNAASDPLSLKNGDIYILESEDKR